MLRIFMENAGFAVLWGCSVIHHNIGLQALCSLINKKTLRTLPLIRQGSQGLF